MKETPVDIHTVRRGFGWREWKLACGTDWGDDHSLYQKMTLAFWPRELRMADV